MTYILLTECRNFRQAYQTRGRMWFEEPPSQRVSVLRSEEAIATGARTLATACPFCSNVMADGMAGTQGGENVNVLDIAELLLSRRRRDSR